MSKPHGIIIFGANGSGKTTLGRELSRILGFKHMDIEDYYFKASEIPYTVARSREECFGLMLADIEKYRSFVLTAVTGDFGQEIEQFYELGLFLSAPMDLRLSRIERRVYEQHGERVQEGGDMVEGHRKFMEFAKSRPLSRIDEWAKTLVCPVIRLDGTEDYRQNAEMIAKRFYPEDGILQSG